MLLGAQLAIATAADQRALSWAALLIGGATGALGGGIALLTQSRPDPLLAILAILFAAALLAACHLAIDTISPTLFCVPGNRPSNWLPEEWDPGDDDVAAIAKARAQQAEQIDEFIKRNDAVATANGAKMRRSIGIAFWAVVVAAAALFAILVSRHYTIREPISEIVRTDAH